jgi:hypothetical protein
MTKPDPVWNLLKAAESALPRFKDAVAELRLSVKDGLADECFYALDYLEKAVKSCKEARNAEAS